MAQRRRAASWIVLALAPALAMAACDQAGSLWPRVRAPADETQSALEATPLEARALSGSVRPQDEMAAALAPEPVLAAPGEILVGARDEADADAAAQKARDVLARLGLVGTVSKRGAGLLMIDLAAAQLQAASAAAPLAMEWNDAERCPHFITQGALEADAALATRCVIQTLKAARRFAFVEPNYIAKIALSPRPQSTQAPPGNNPNDPLLPLQWSFRGRGAGEGLSLGGAGFRAMWRAHQRGARTARVAVLDTGIDLSHPDIRSSGNVASGVDLIANAERAGDGGGADADAKDSGDRCADGDENSYHGAQIAGLIGAAATNDHVGVAGANWAVSVIPVRVLGRCGGELADIVTGVRWAAGAGEAHARANIINLSFTLQAPCPASLQAAIDAAVAANVVVVAAAGNKAELASKFAPGNCANVISVGATDGQGALAFYSNFGPELDLVAPGGDMFADLDSDGRPDGILSARATERGCADPVTGNSTPRCWYSYAQGTSYAAAHVSAALALLAAQSGLEGKALERALFDRAVSAFPRHFGEIECARSRNAVPLNAALCARPSGRGFLDLARAARILDTRP